jgi:phosphoglycolate phosphatase-like HAD superfamily hydrolase
MKEIKAVIFDLDGTIANTLPLCIQAFRQSIEPLINRSVTDEEIIATFGPLEEGTIMALASDHYDKGVADYLHFYQALHGMCPSAFEGIEELLQLLKSNAVHIAIVTGKGKYSTAISLSQFALSHFFESIETGSAAGPRKAEGIRAVADLWKDIKNEAIIYVGDAPADIAASRTAGIRIVAASWAATAEPEKLKALQPDQLFYTIDEFTNWIRGRI